METKDKVFSAEFFIKDEEGVLTPTLVLETEREGLKTYTIRGYYNGSYLSVFFNHTKVLKFDENITIGIGNALNENLNKDIRWIYLYFNEDKPIILERTNDNRFLYGKALIEYDKKLVEENKKMEINRMVERLMDDLNIKPIKK